MPLIAVHEDYFKMSKRVQGGASFFVLMDAIVSNKKVEAAYLVLIDFASSRLVPVKVLPWNSICFLLHALHTGYLMKYFRFLWGRKCLEFVNTEGNHYTTRWPIYIKQKVHLIFLFCSIWLFTVNNPNQILHWVPRGSEPLVILRFIFVSITSSQRLFTVNKSSSGKAQGNKNHCRKNEKK